jgi:hypothetical protein
MGFRRSLARALAVAFLSAGTFATTAALFVDWEAVALLACGPDADEEACRLEEARQRLSEYQDTLAGAVDDLQAHRCALGEAVDRLAATERAYDPECARQLRSVYGGATARENLAASLLDHALIEEPATPAARQYNRDLLAGFRAHYGHTPRLFTDVTARD